jgi:hypothetical protein
MVARNIRYSPKDLVAFRSRYFPKNCAVQRMRKRGSWKPLKFNVFIMILTRLYNILKFRIDVFYHRFGNGIPGHTARAPP